MIVRSPNRTFQLTPGYMLEYQRDGLAEMFNRA